MFGRGEYSHGGAARLVKACAEGWAATLCRRCECELGLIAFLLPLIAIRCQPLPISVILAEALTSITQLVFQVIVITG